MKFWACTRWKELNNGHYWLLVTLYECFWAISPLRLIWRERYCSSCRIWIYIQFVVSLHLEILVLLLICAEVYSPSFCEYWIVKWWKNKRNEVYSTRLNLKLFIISFCSSKPWRQSISLLHGPICTIQSYGRSYIITCYLVLLQYLTNPWVYLWWSYSSPILSTSCWSYFTVFGPIKKKKIFFGCFCTLLFRGICMYLFIINFCLASCRCLLRSCQNF